MKTEKHPLVPTVPSGLDPKLSRWMTDITNSFLKLSRTTRSDLDSVIGVGFFYTQYPDADSNDEAVAFPVAKAPAAIFGGTWEEQWDDEATYFRTRGDPNVAEDQDVGRTNGLQPDQGQLHFHNWAFIKYGAVFATGGDNGYYSASGTPTPTQITEEITDGIHGPPRGGYTTQVTNRLCIKWKRTA
jgi:hypothetical protein